MNKEDMTPEEKELIKELRKIEIKKQRQKEKILDELLWGAARYGNYDGVLRRKKAAAERQFQ